MRAVDGLQLLGRAVGNGELVAKCTVDQPYAQAQHEDLTLQHNDGSAKYLERPLFENVNDVISTVARHLITPGGSDIVNGMIEVCEMMSQWVEEHAPRETSALRFSGHPQVVDNGTVVYDRPPKIPRKQD